MPPAFPSHVSHRLSASPERGLGSVSPWPQPHLHSWSSPPPPSDNLELPSVHLNPTFTERKWGKIRAWNKEAGTSFIPEENDLPYRKLSCVSVNGRSLCGWPLHTVEMLWAAPSIAVTANTSWALTVTRYCPNCLAYPISLSPYQPLCWRCYHLCHFLGWGTRS